ncbi:MULTISPECIES: 4-hydroxy-2-oxovalerate aldolase [Rhodococcus]|uniref:4-hydroxy-2-oxovalerate aldolase n=1 Tax=Rhodococcus TaxID=1827 RepID=UPI0006BB50DC|nr:MULTISPECIES: 4-hydroxy-2-oxovalerate aldolase [Rhodococcus]QHE73810.1 2,4-dihydroxyhept-2-ene-1,7-dioic acid aldolase [Rhodococcus sp. WAY2]
MQSPINSFKKALAAGRTQIGFWLALGDAYSAEVCAGAGFDWLLIDGEHAPQDLRSVLAQLQVIGAYRGCHAAVRVPSADTTVIKQYLDLGAQSLLVPMVDTADEAAAVVRACRYPPGGIRGVGGARASRWGRYPRYLHEADEQVCVVVQAETALALSNLEAIAEVDGIDGVFIGTADLAASLGFPGNPAHPEVQDAILDALQRVRAAGKAPGVLTPVEDLAQKYLAHGAVFVAVGIDTHLLAKQTSALAARFAQVT